MDEKEVGYSLCLHGREVLELNGIEDVFSFEDCCVVLQTAGGMLTVDGEGLHIQRLEVENGELVVEGRVCGLYYTETPPKKSGRKRDRRER